MHVRELDQTMTKQKHENIKVDNVVHPLHWAMYPDSPPIGRIIFIVFLKQGRCTILFYKRVAKPRFVFYTKEFKNCTYQQILRKTA